MVYKFFELIEKLTDGETKEKLAKTILLAQDIREDKSNFAEGRYIKNDSDCVLEAAKETKIDDFYIQVACELNSTAWNESQEWAKNILSNN